MTTWALLLVMFMGGSHGAAGGMTAIQGFTSREACEAAAWAATKRPFENPSQPHFPVPSALCIEVR